MGHDWSGFRGGGNGFWGGRFFPMDAVLRQQILEARVLLTQPSQIVLFASKCHIVVDVSVDAALQERGVTRHVVSLSDIVAFFRIGMVEEPALAFAGQPIALSGASWGIGLCPFDPFVFQGRIEGVVSERRAM